MNTIGNGESHAVQCQVNPPISVADKNTKLLIPERGQCYGINCRTCECVGCEH